MADFTSGFWNYWITIPTLGGLVGCILLIRWLSSGTGAPEGKVETMGHVWDGDLAEYNNPLPRWWLNMFYITIFFAFGYLALYPGLGTWAGYFGWSSRGEWDAEMRDADLRYGPIFEKFAATPIPALANDPEARRVGERLYASYCATCHGSDARGVRGYPNLRDHDWLWGGEPETIVTTITGGRQAAMPPWGAVLGEAGVNDVVEYVLGLSGTAVDAGSAARGAKIYAQNCAACHGPEAKGQTILGAPNLTDDTWLYGGSKTRLIETVTHGRGGVMPAWGPFLGPAKVHVLAAYVWGLSNTGDAAPGGHSTAQND